MPPPPPSKLRRKDPRRHEGLCLPSLPPSLLPRPVWHPSLSAQVGHSPLAVPRRRRIKSSLRHSIKKAFAARRREGERKIRSIRGRRGKGRTAQTRGRAFTHCFLRVACKQSQCGWVGAKSCRSTAKWKGRGKLTPAPPDARTRATKWSLSAKGREEGC